MTSARATPGKWHIHGSQKVFRSFQEILERTALDRLHLTIRIRAEVITSFFCDYHATFYVAVILICCFNNVTRTTFCLGL